MIKPYNSHSKYFFIMRGIPGSGKSTFVAKYLKNISNVVESDVFRQNLMGLDENGKINQENGQAVWYEIDKYINRILYSCESVTLDATNISSYLLRKYQRIAEKYGYEFIIIDFSNIPLEKALQQNLNRVFSKQISNEVIERMHRQLIKENTKLQFETFTKDEFLKWLGIEE